MFLYIDSLFAEGRERVVRPLHTIPETLNGLYLLSMREHLRDAVIMYREGERWQRSPDWRLDRHAIRTAIYLGERLEVEPGDRIVLISELRPEWPVVDFAALGLGALSVALPTDVSADELAELLAELAPRAVFVSDAVLGTALSVREALPQGAQLVSFADTTPSEGVTLFASVLDLGGTFDTPERAQKFRATAREAAPHEPAIRHYRRTDSGRLEREELTQGGVIERLKRDWLEQPANEDDIAYLVGPEVGLDLRLATYRFVGDGRSTVALGSPGHAPEEIRRLRPAAIVASAAVIQATLERPLEPAAEDGRGLRDWLRSLVRLTSTGVDPQNRESLREALGGRARWIGPTTPLDPTLSARLNAALAVSENGQSTRRPNPGEAAS